MVLPKRLVSLCLMAITLRSIYGMECTHPYVRLATGCYYFSGAHATNWWKASEACRGLDGALAVINDPLENQVISQYLAEADPKRHYFAGGYDLGHEGVWYWESNRRPVDYFDWHPNQPDNAGGNEHCLDLRNGGNGFHWNDIPCIAVQSFVCEAIPERKEVAWQVTGIKFQVEPAQMKPTDWEHLQAN